MTEITRVPLQPIARGSLPKLWLGVVAAILVAAGVAWAALPAQVRVETLLRGSGDSPTLNDVALVKIKGTLDDGKVFQPEAQGPIDLNGGAVPGFVKALLQMQRGGKYRAEIPWELAYGAEEQRNPQTGKVEIPAKSDLTFEIELIDFRSHADIEREQRMMQQLQQMQAQQQGAPGSGSRGGPPPGGPMGPPPGMPGGPPPPQQ